MGSHVRVHTQNSCQFVHSSHAVSCQQYIWTNKIVTCGGACLDNSPKSLQVRVHDEGKLLNISL